MQYNDNVPGYDGKTIIALDNKTVYNQLKANDFVNSVVGAYVTGDGIAKGTNLAATANINENQFVLSQSAAPAMHVLLSGPTNRNDGGFAISSPGCQAVARRSARRVSAEGMLNRDA